MTALPMEKRYTYADYLEWPEGTRVELIYGQIYDMAPAPSTRHQSASMEIIGQIWAYLRGKTCKVFAAPFDVRLFEEEGDRSDETDTVVQPDITVICDPSRLDARGYRGAPHMVAEILSPTTRGHDMLTKFHLYQRAGVREYWLVDTENKTVQVFILQNGSYVASVYGPGDKIKLSVLEDCQVDLTPVFDS